VEGHDQAGDGAGPVWTIIQHKPADTSRTFGYQRAGVLAAFVNALTIVALSAWMLYESWVRLMNPVAVNEFAMLWVAAAALVLNGGIMWGLHSSSRHDLNLRSAFIHMLGDLLGAAAIILGAILMRFTGWVQVDPILSIAIALLIVWTAWDVIRESLNILLEGLPRGVDLDDVVSSMRRIGGVLDVHDLHIWSLGSSSHALSCHVLIEDMPPSQSDCILTSLNSMLGSFPPPPHHHPVRACKLRRLGLRLRGPGGRRPESPRPFPPHPLRPRAFIR